MARRITTRTRTYDAGTGATARARMAYPWHKLRKPGDWFLWKLARRRSRGRDRAEVNLRVTAHKQRRRRGLILTCTKTRQGLVVTVVGLDL